MPRLTGARRSSRSDERTSSAPEAVQAGAFPGRGPGKSVTGEGGLWQAPDSDIMWGDEEGDLWLT